MAFNMNGKNRAPMSEINVTPLVDVMLVLLIIFMITAPMLQEGVSVELPQAPGKDLAPSQTKEPVVISVSQEGEIYVNNDKVEPDALTEKVLAATKESESSDVFLKADTKVPYGTVVGIIGRLQSAGIKNLGIITTPEEKRSQSQ
jgi:biopolymer transport protein TolR